jgi:arabinan endo-1,5-alpha-L-arabinosidase
MVIESLSSRGASGWRFPHRRVPMRSSLATVTGTKESRWRTTVVRGRGPSRRAGSLAAALATGTLLTGSLVGGPTATAAPVESAAGSAVATSASSSAAGSAAAPAGRRAAYRNPVSKGFADTFADPSVVRGKDGWWYAYGTSDPLREGEGTPHRIPTARSRDLVNWTFTGDAFGSANLPRWADTGAGAALWAPDIRYVDGQYRMYYVVTQTTVTDEQNDNAVGMATAPTPTGPWTDSGAPVVGPRRGPGGGAGNFLWTFDPTAVTDTDGSQWLLYGSYYGGIFITRLSGDGRRAVGSPTQLAIDNKFEGAYVVRRDGYWYLFASTANCCAGPTTGYSVHVGRSRDLRGPYLDREGTPLTTSRAGGTPTLVQNGNQFVGAGHNAVVTDLGGQDWIAYHAIDRRDPYLDGTAGINERPMLLDRLDWIGGWPAVRAGRGPSAGTQAGPLTCGASAACLSAGPARAGWRDAGRWVRAVDQQAGAHAVARSAGTLTRRAPRGPVRVEADLRSSGPAYGLVAAARGSRDGLRVVVNNRSHRVTLRLTAGGRTTASVSSPLPAGFDPRDWHAVSLQVRGRVAMARLTHARLGDPLADLRLTLPSASAGTGGRAGAVAGGSGVRTDNVSVLRATAPVRRLARVHVPSRLDPAASDEFNGSAVRPGWTWVRRDDAATVTAGVLRWRTQAADLTGTGNDAGVLLRDLGDGAWTAETKVTIDLGTDTIRNFQQAGIVAYAGDDLFARLSHVAIWNTRQVEFGKEMPFAEGLSYGGTIVGPPATTTWLRLTHRVDPSNGEHELRGWSSRDGRRWVQGGVWTLPAGADVRVGLVSHGRSGSDAPATANFDYLRVYRD